VLAQRKLLWRVYRELAQLIPSGPTRLPRIRREGGRAQERTLSGLGLVIQVRVWARRNGVVVKSNRRKKRGRCGNA